MSYRQKVSLLWFDYVVEFLVGISHSSLGTRRTESLILISRQENMRTSHQRSSSDLSLPADTYVYRVLRISGSNIFATISSNDALRVIDESLQLLPNGTFDRVHDGVTCLENFEASVGCLVTAGRDAAVKVWDPRTRSQNLQLPKRKGECSGARKDKTLNCH